MFREKDVVYDIGSISLMIYTFLILIIRFGIFPIFVDIYYHLSVMQGYNLAGGVTKNAYWEFAPFGRPQLYPPLLHLIMLMFLKAGASLVFIAKFTSFIMFPITVLVVWFSVRSIYGKRAAFFSTCIISGSEILFWHMSVLSAAALAQIFGLLAFVAVEKKLNLAVPVLLALMLYSHIAIPYFYFIAFLLYGILRRERRKLIFVSLGISLLLYSPWLIHTILHMGYISPRTMNGPGIVPVQIYLDIWLWAFGLGGVFVSIIRRKAFLFPSLLLISLIPVMFGYPTRFWEAHAPIPLSILSGIFISWFLDFVETQNIRKIAFVLFFIVLVITPHIAYEAEKISFSIQPSFEVSALESPKNLTLPFFTKNRVKEKRKLFTPVNRNDGRFFTNGERLLSMENINFANTLKKKLPSGATIYTPDSIFGDFLFAFSGVPVSSGMLREVRPYSYPKQVDDSYLVVSGNVPSLIFPLSKYFKKSFSAFGETVFKNRFGAKKVFPEKPVLPNSVSFILIIISAIIILKDFTTRRNE